MATTIPPEVWARARAAQQECRRIRRELTAKSERPWHALEDGAIAQTCPTAEKEDRDDR